MSYIIQNFIDLSTICVYFHHFCQIGLFGLVGDDKNILPKKQLLSRQDISNNDYFHSGEGYLPSAVMRAMASMTV